MGLNANFIILVLNFILKMVLRIFLFENIWIKIFCILITGGIIYVIKYKYPFKRRFRKLSQLRTYKKKDNFLKWALITRKDHILNIIILTGAVLVFIVGFFILRFKNTSRDVDLKNIFDTFYFLIKILPNYVIILDLILLANIFFIFVFFMKEIRKFIKRELIRRHLYSLSFSEEPSNWYTKFIQEYSVKFLSRIYGGIRKLSKFLILKIYKKRYNDPAFEDQRFRYQIKLMRFFAHLFNNIHYYILFITLMVDIYINNFHLIYIYKILLITFLYDLFLKYYNFIDQLSNYHDNSLKYGIYWFDRIIAVKKGIIYFDDGGAGIDLDDFTKAVNIYLEAGLNQQAIRDYEDKEAGKIDQNQKKNNLKQILVIVIISITLIIGLIYFKINY